MEKVTESKIEKPKVQNVDHLPDIIKDFGVTNRLGRAITRYRETLFEVDLTDFSRFKRRVEGFDGYHPGDHNARGYRNDSLGQLYGTIGELKFRMAVARQAGRELSDEELAKTKSGLVQASRMEKASVWEYEPYSTHIASRRRRTAKQMRILSRNVPTIVKVIQEMERRTS